MQFKNNTLMTMVIIVWTVLCLGIGMGGAEAIDLFKGSPKTQTGSAPPPAPSMSAAPASFSDLAKKASPSVVNISVVKKAEGMGESPQPFGSDDPFRDFFDRFFRDQMPVPVTV